MDAATTQDIRAIVAAFLFSLAIMPYGRGGAGNYSYEASASVSAATKQNTSSHTDALSPSLEIAKQGPAAAGYASGGRGGAGNFSQDHGVHDQARIADLQPSKSPYDEGPSTTVYRGRGGVGNLESAAADNKKHAYSLDAEVAKQQDAIRKNVANNVEHTLARPAKARLPVEEPCTSP